MTRPVGRPPVPKKLAKGSLVAVRFSEGQRRSMEQAAKRESLSLSEWMRRILLDATEKKA